MDNRRSYVETAVVMVAPDISGVEMQLLTEPQKGIESENFYLHVRFG